MFSVLKQASGILWLSGKIDKEIKWAQTIALTKTAVLARKILRTEAHDVFTIRRKYTERGIQIRPAKIADEVPQAIVFGGPSYLSYHALGVPKLPSPGAKTVASPTLDLRGVFSKPITKGKRASTLIRRVRPPSFGKKKRRKVGRRPIFLHFDKGDKKKVALVRASKTPERGRRFEFLYFFAPRYKIKERYDFHGIVGKVAAENYERIFKIEFEKGMKKALKRRG